MEFKIALGKDEVLKLCEKDKNFEVYIQQAALNYIKNCRLKPLMKEHIIEEIEKFKKDLKPNVQKALKEIGISEDTSWYQSSVALSTKVKEELKKQVKLEMTDLITKTVNEELTQANEQIKEDIADWDKVIKFRIDKELTPAKIKALAREILEHKISLLK